MKPPELPKRTVELLPLMRTAEDPQKPPVDYTLRCVLFVDCTGNEPVQLFALPAHDKESVAALKEKLRDVALHGKVWPCVMSSQSVPCSSCRAAYCQR